MQSRCISTETQPKHTSEPRREPAEDARRNPGSWSPANSSGIAHSGVDMGSDAKSMLSEDFEVHPRLEWHLLNWRDWMRPFDTRSLEAPGHSTGFVGGGYSTDSDTMLRRADVTSAEKMDALIASLTPSQSAAINHRYLSSVYRFPRSSFAAEFAVACDRLLAWMPKRGLV